MTAAPTTARAAVALWYALAAFGVLDAGYLWLRRADGPADRLVEFTAAAVVFGAVYAVLARLLGRRVRWARGALTAVAAIHVLWIVLTLSAGPNLVVLLLIGAGSAFTWSRGTAEWVGQH